MCSAKPSLRFVSAPSPLFASQDNTGLIQGRNDTALAAYKKGRYLLDSRSGALLGLPPGAVMTEQQREKHRRVFEKVWSQVENIMGDLRSTLGKRLRDPRRGLEEVEKTIEYIQFAYFREMCVADRMISESCWSWIRSAIRSGYISIHNIITSCRLSELSMSATIPSSGAFWIRWSLRLQRKTRSELQICGPAFWRWRRLSKN